MERCLRRASKVETPDLYLTIYLSHSFKKKKVYVYVICVFVNAEQIVWKYMCQLFTVGRGT